MHARVKAFEKPCEHCGSPMPSGIAECPECGTIGASSDVSAQETKESAPTWPYAEVFGKKRSGALSRLKSLLAPRRRRAGMTRPDAPDWGLTFGAAAVLVVTVAAYGTYALVAEWDGTSARFSRAMNDTTNAQVSGAVDGNADSMTTGRIARILQSDIAAMRGDDSADDIDLGATRQTPPRHDQALVKPNSTPAIPHAVRPPPSSFASAWPFHPLWWMPPRGAAGLRVGPATEACGRSQSCSHMAPAAYTPTHVHPPAKTSRWAAAHQRPRPVPNRIAQVKAVRKRSSDDEYEARIAALAAQPVQPNGTVPTSRSH